MVASLHAPTAKFLDVFRAEAEAINARRAAVAEGKLAEDRGHRWPETRPGNDTKRVIVEQPKHAAGANMEPPRARPLPGHDLVGFALSGGGVRSASVCLGALQGLDAGRQDCEPQILDTVDYLSTVSGGGFMGLSLVSGLMQARGCFPFASKLDQDETIETKHLRDYANYLAPTGVEDIIVGLLAVLRGLVVNAIAFLSLILLAAAGLVLLDPTRSELRQPLFLRALGDGWTGYIFTWTWISGGILALVGATSVIWAAHRERPLTLAQRERLNRVHLILFGIWLLIFAIEVQAYLIDGLFGAVEDPAPDDGNLATRLLVWVTTSVEHVWPAIVSGAVALIASASKLTSTLRATLGDRTRAGLVTRWMSRIAIYLAALIAPLLIWGTYLLFAYWGVANTASHLDLHAHTPCWLQAVAGIFPESRGYFYLYLIVGSGLLAVSLCVTPNAGSLHGYYRDRLSRAFLWDLDTLKSGSGSRRTPSSFGAVDTYTFHSLKSFTVDAHGERVWSADVRFAPYILVNTAVNLEGSETLNRRGRNADNFIFSPLYIGSETTGYATSTRVEQLASDVNLATAMAASGAAASANMGASTIKALTFTLSAFNIRLGYWLPNPRKMPSWGHAIPRSARIGLPYFVKETFGWITENSDHVYLTDGGHYDNLGLYELLKRRCRVIIAVDAEADPTMNFDSLVRVQRYARIDLGVLIDLPWPTLKQHSVQVTADATAGPSDRIFQQHGPHVAIGHIQYGEAVPTKTDEDDSNSGVLIYVKASLSGDESDLVRDYKRRNSDFPHETTIDQFFSEEQFEVYRSLGFHILSRLVEGKDDVAIIDPDAHPGWLGQLEHALRRINIADSAVASIMARAGHRSAAGHVGRPVAVH